MMAGRGGYFSKICYYVKMTGRWSEGIYYTECNGGNDFVSDDYIESVGSMKGIGGKVRVSEQVYNVEFMAQEDKSL